MISLKKDFKNISLIILFVFVLGISVNVFAANVSCTGVFDSEFLQMMNNYVYKPIKWAVPILLLVLTSFDFAKVVFNGKKEDMDKAKNNFMKRVVSGLIIFFAPDLIILIVDLVSQNNIKECLPRFK